MVDAPERPDGPEQTITKVAANLGLSGHWTAMPGHRASRVLWRLQTQGRTLWFKTFGSGRGAHQAIAAYQSWAPKLDGVADLVHVARLRSETVVVLEHCAGIPVASSHWTPAQREVIHWQAGAWLARLHAIPLNHRDAMSVSDAIGKRRDATCRRARAVLNPKQLQALERIDERLFDGVERVPCHRDFSARNWLFDIEHHRLVVLDFEHSAADVRWADIVKLQTGAWREQPGLEQSFWRGYGRTPDTVEQSQLEAMVLLHGVNTLLWGLEHGDAEFEALGARILRETLAGR